MAQRRHHYERAFEGYLREQRLAYMAVNEARRALLPRDAKLVLERGKDGSEDRRAIKNFDFVVYGDQQSGIEDEVDGGSADNLLVEIKGRRLPRLRLKDGAPAKARLESWVTMDDVDAMRAWEGLFGTGYTAVFVFVYWCDDVPPDGLFTEVFSHGDRWYTLRAVTLRDYEAHMRVRSPKWKTVNLSSEDFDRLWRGFCGGGSRRVVGLEVAGAFSGV